VTWLCEFGGILNPNAQLGLVYKPSGNTKIKDMLMNLTQMTKVLDLALITALCLLTA
jgi:hypothetical protein